MSVKSVSKSTLPNPTNSLKGAGGVIFTVLFVMGFVLFYIGERLITESHSWRISLDLVALIGILAAIIGRLFRRQKLGSEARPVETRILICYLVGLAGLLLYVAQADFVMERLRPLFTEAKGVERYQTVLGVLWPVIWLSALFPLIFMEISYSSMDVAKTVELARIRRSARSGLILSMTIALVFVLNFIISEFNQKVDLSYFKTTRASESSRKMVQHLSEPFTVTLFFPGANEVQDQVLAYFEDLKKESKYFQIRTVDHAMEPELAKELSVSENGTVALSRGKQTEQISLGTTLTRAKATLKKLDNEFQNRFTKLSQSQKVAYLTVGHEERGPEDRDKVKGSSIKIVRTILQKLNYSIKELGIGQGLASEVPKDATLVIIPGPRKDFLPAEIEALKKYLFGGGRMMAFLDPEAGLDMAALLNPFGLKFIPVPLANDKFYVRLTHTPADRSYLFTNRFSSHPSVTTLTRNSNQLASVMLGVGALEEIPPIDKSIKPQIQFTLHAMPFTWNDLNKNFVVDTPDETRKNYEMAAVATLKVDKPTPPAATKGKKAEAPEMRFMVVADSDVISDQVFGNPGNGYLFMDALKWLGGEEEFIGEVTSEEDVRIMHTRKEDQLWFYLTIFGVPALVLGAGLGYTTRRRKKS